MPTDKRCMRDGADLPAVTSTPLYNAACLHVKARCSSSSACLKCAAMLVGTGWKPVLLVGVRASCSCRMAGSCIVALTLALSRAWTIVQCAGCNQRGRGDKGGRAGKEHGHPVHRSSTGIEPIKVARASCPCKHAEQAQAVETPASPHAVADGEDLQSAARRVWHGSHQARHRV